MNPTVVILLVATCVAASCALVGAFLVLRRMALLGDAISHAVLPGIVIAFLWLGSRSTWPMVLGAAATGVMTVFLIDLLTRTRRIRSDAAIGVVFPGLFAIGVILAHRYAENIDLDPQCVLFGEIGLTPYTDLVIAGVQLGPRALWVSAVILVIDVLVVFALYKEFELTSFDPALATALGFSPVLVHYVLMSLVSVTVVGSFEAVGAILVVAMLIVPPATAYLLVDRLAPMLALSVAIGVADAWLGYAIAYHYNASIAGGMATATGITFVLAWIASPRHGLLRQFLGHRRLRRRFDGQIVLLHLKDRTMPMSRNDLARRFGWSHARIDHAIATLRADDAVDGDDAALRITPTGERALDAAGTAPLAHEALP